MLTLAIILLKYNHLEEFFKGNKSTRDFSKVQPDKFLNQAKFVTS